jgi:putative oxidoreductase
MEPNLYDGDSWPWIAGQITLAALFIHRGLSAVGEFSDYVEQLTKRGVPMAAFVLAGGLLTMLTGGLMVAADAYAFWGAILLIVFTLLANHWFHHFWQMDGLMRKLHFYFFCNNISIIGGLLLVMSK